MNKTMMWIVGAVILVVAGGGLFVANQNSQKAEKDTMMQKDSSTDSGQAMMDNKMAKGNYVEYSKAALDDASANRRVLFFYANWCPTCRPTDADLTANKSKLPADVTVLRVNYNDTDTDQEEKDLAKKYGITYQHTFVQIDVNGKEIAKWNGGQIDELLANIK